MRRGTGAGAQARKPGRRCWGGLRGDRGHELGEIFGEAEHVEDPDKIRQGQIAAAVLEVLVGGSGKTGPAGYFSLGPVAVETVLAHMRQKEANGFAAGLHRRRGFLAFSQIHTPNLRGIINL